MKLNIERLKELERNCETIRKRLAVLQEAVCSATLFDCFGMKKLMINTALAEKEIINLQMDLVYAMQHDGNDGDSVDPDNPLPNWDGEPHPADGIWTGYK